MIDNGSAEKGGGNWHRHLPWIQALLVNAVPLLGHWKLGWAMSTTVALYWCENVLGSIFVFARLVIHHHLTHDPGYDHKQLGVSSSISISGFASKSGAITRFIPEFAAAATIFTAAHGLFLLLLTIMLLPGGQPPVDRGAFRHGLLVIFVVISLHFLNDLRAIGQRPFSWVRSMASGALSRIVVLHLTIVVGGVLLVFTENVALFFGTFSLLKLGGDVVSALPRTAPAAGDEPAAPSPLGKTSARATRRGSRLGGN